MSVDVLGLPSMQAMGLVEGTGDRKGTLIIKASITEETKSCRHCGGKRFHGHGLVEQTVADTPFHGKPTTLLISRKRFRCLDCGKTFVEAAPDIHPKRMATNRLLKIDAFSPHYLICTLSMS